MLARLKKFLFANQTVSQTIFKNSFWLALAEIINKVLIFVLFIYVARILGAADYGKFNFAIALMYLLNILPGLVSPEIVTREFSRDKEKEKEHSALLSLKIILGLGSAALLIAGSFFLTPDPILRKVIWILALYNFFGVPIDLFYAFFRGRQQMQYESFIKILDAFLSGIFVFLVIFKFPSVENLSYAYLAEGFLLILLVVLLFHFKIQRLTFSFDKSVWKKIITLSWPMALAGLTLAIFSQIDSVIMGYLGQMAENGWYNAASKITKLSLVPVILFSQSFFPALSKVSAQIQNLQKIFHYQLRIMIILAVPLTLGGIILAPKLIEFLYGQTYLPSILAFQILMLTVGLTFLYDAFRQIMIINNQQKRFFFIIASGAAANLILNLILIPRFSLYGAAVASVISNFLLLILFIRFSSKFINFNLFNLNILSVVLASAAAGLAMYFVISWSWVFQLNVIISILIGGSVYFTSLYLLRFLKLQYVSRIKN